MRHRDERILVGGVAIIILAVLLVMLFSGCNPAKQADRKAYRDAVKARALVAEAITLDPSILQTDVRVDTIVVYTEPSAGVGQRTYSQASMDSLAVICSRLVSKYRNKADSAALHKEIRYLTSGLCDFETITVADTNLLLKIWAEDGSVRYWYNVLPRVIKVPTKTSELTVTTNPTPAQKPERGWGHVWWLLFIIGLILVVLKWGGKMWRVLRGFLPFVFVLLCLSVSAQGGSHQMPPVVNVVGAGFNLEHAVQVREAAMWTLIIGSAATTAFALADAPDAALGIGALTFGTFVSLNLHSLKWERRSAALWKCGYSPMELYETIPDSIGQGELKRYRVPDMIQGMPIHPPAR